MAPSSKLRQPVEVSPSGLPVSDEEVLETTPFRRYYVPLEPISPASGRVGGYLWAFIAPNATEFGRAVFDVAPGTALMATLLGLFGIEWLERQWVSRRE